VADILHDLPLAVSPARVFEAVSAPAGLDRWWSLHATGRPERGATYTLDFGPGASDWRARVTACAPSRTFELEVVDAMPDWVGTRVCFELEPSAAASTQLRFAHLGWPGVTTHYRVSSYRWAMYLRLLRRNVETGEVVPYPQRLDV
jgi:uncharacterized protein YndB with AHSA1/START domain